MKPLIVLYEPQCVGYSHANFNAALLQTTLSAYPEATVVFKGEAGHLQWVRAAFQQHLGELPKRVQWVETKIPPVNILGPGTVAKHRAAYAELLRQAQSSQAALLLLCSLSCVGLHVLKQQMHRHPVSVPVVGVFHGVLSAITGTRSKNPMNWWFTLRRALALPHPPGLRYIALGQSIHQSLQHLLPGAIAHFSVLDIPTLWKPLPNERAEQEPISFGYFGVGRRGLKGFELFVRLASDMGGLVEQGRCRFVLVGFLRDDASSADPGLGRIVGLSHSPLTPEEYTRRAAAVTYAIWAGQSEQYALRASASFVDTLCMGKPGVYLRAPYVESYCNQMSDIGFLCDDYEQMLRVAVEVTSSFPEDRYAQQCANVIEGSKVFHPEALAPRLRAITDQCR